MKAQETLNQLNRLVVDYEEWLKRQQQSFIDAIKSVQLIEPVLISQKIKSLKEFLSLFNIVHHHKTRVEFKSVKIDKFTQFFVFWERLCPLTNEITALVGADVPQLLQSLPYIKNPQYLPMIRSLSSELIRYSSVDCNFATLHENSESRSCLHRYRLLIGDSEYGDLVGFIPALVKIASKICWLIENL